MFESDPKISPMYKDSKPWRENSFKNLTIFPATASNPYTRVKYCVLDIFDKSQTQLDPSFTFKDKIGQL